MTTKNSTASATALRLLNSPKFKVHWKERGLLKADFDYDRIIDYALTGRKKNSFCCRRRQRFTDWQIQTLEIEFSQDAGSQDAHCSVREARISLERLSCKDELEKALKPLKKSLGINLPDDRHDPFHIYCNPADKRFTRWLH